MSPHSRPMSPIAHVPQLSSCKASFPFHHHFTPSQNHSIHSAFILAPPSLPASYTPRRTSQPSQPSPMSPVPHRPSTDHPLPRVLLVRSPRPGLTSFDLHFPLSTLHYTLLNASRVRLLGRSPAAPARIIRSGLFIRRVSNFHLRFRAYSPQRPRSLTPVSAGRPKHNNRPAHNPYSSLSNNSFTPFHLCFPIPNTTDPGINQSNR